MTADAGVTERLTAWLRDRLPEADDVRIEGLDRVNFGHSAEMMVLTIVTGRGDGEGRHDADGSRCSRSSTSMPASSRANSRYTGMSCSASSIAGPTGLTTVA